MAQIISVSIDLSKLDKTRIIEGKNGAKYYNLTINVNDQKDNYGNDASVTTAQTKEEREAKQPRTFVGNGKIIWTSQNHQSAPTQPKPQFPTSFVPPAQDAQGDDSDLPF